MFKLIIKFILIFPSIIFPDKIFYIEMKASEEILTSKICSKTKDKQILNQIFPLSKDEYVLISPIKNPKICGGKKKFKKIKIKSISLIEFEGDIIFIPFLDLKNYNYILERDEWGNWKVSHILDLKQKQEKNTSTVEYFSKKNNNKINERAVYFWDTIEILKSKKEWQTFLNNLKKTKINKVYIQIPYKINEGRSWTKKRKVFFDFIGFLLKNEIDLEFLDGYKGFALEPFHKTVLNQIRNLKYFWNKHLEKYPFPPIHLDIEPYLLRFYNNLNYKEIYNEYINLLKKIKVNYPDVELNLDIPFWLDSLDEEILKEIIKYSDGITIMAYRSKVYGSNGVIDITEREVSLAKKESKKVYIAIETMELPPDKVYGVFEAKGEEFPLYLHKTIKENLFIISEKPSEYGIKVVEETPSDFISLYKYSWEEIENFAEEISSYYGDKIDGIAIHHWGSLEGKIK